MTTSSRSGLHVEDGRLRRGIRTREQLLNAAIRLFGSQGFAATSMRDLASAAGMQAAGIYNHFDSKERILAAALVWALEDFKAQVVDADDPTLDPVMRLEALVRRHVTYQLENAQTVRYTDNLLESVMLGELLTPDDQSEIRVYTHGYRNLMTHLVEEVRGESPAEIPATSLCVLAILDLCDKSSSWFRTGGELSVEDVKDGYWNLIAGMLRLA